MGRKPRPRAGSNVHRTAHQLGLHSNATMLYGHIDGPKHRIDHLVRLRELQDETGGFQTFIPLAFHPDNSQMADIPKPSGVMDLKVMAISRLMLDNFPHIKAYWVMLGLKTAQVALSFGADDLDGTVVHEKIYHEAGAETPQEVDRRRDPSPDHRSRPHSGRARHAISSRRARRRLVDHPRAYRRHGIDACRGGKKLILIEFAAREEVLACQSRDPDPGKPSPIRHSGVPMGDTARPRRMVNYLFTFPTTWYCPAMTMSGNAKFPRPQICEPKPRSTAPSGSRQNFATWASIPMWIDAKSAGLTPSRNASPHPSCQSEVVTFALTVPPGHSMIRRISFGGRRCFGPRFFE